ncbi:MAG: spore germination protein, partial [Epulopiscium sp.]|nr:spore germination protein [Candidatus Epulonipiscium sp.]
MNNNLLSNISLTTSLEDNITTFKQIFSDDFTFIAREFQNKYLPSVKFCIFYFKGMVDTEVLNEHVIEPILSENLMEDISLLNLVDELQNKVIMSSDITSSNDFQTILDSMIYGDTVLLVDGYDNALLINSKSWPSRAIDEPESA